MLVTLATRRGVTLAAFERSLGQRWLRWRDDDLSERSGALVLLLKEHHPFLRPSAATDLSVDCVGRGNELRSRVLDVHCFFHLLHLEHALTTSSARACFVERRSNAQTIPRLERLELRIRE